MEYTQKSVSQYIKENDVKFIKLFFTDIFGRAKSVSLMPSELARAFDAGISFDAGAVAGFCQSDENGLRRGDLFLVPDPTTLAVLPWRPQHGRVVRFFCSVKNPDGTQFAADNRAIVTRVVRDVRFSGFSCSVGTECEFYLFNVDERGDAVSPHDNAAYCDLAPRDKGENIRREICLTLEQIGLRPETSRHKAGPGQHEITFKHAGAEIAADNLTMFKMTVQAAAAKNGVLASFMPKPISEKNGSGLHVNVSLNHSGRNLFGKETLPPEAEYFIAGVLNRAREITAFTNPLRNSYKRFGCFEAPKYLSWSPQGRSHLIRMPAADESSARIELRSPDPSCNHYFAIALTLAAGIEGIDNKTAPRDFCDFDPYAADEPRVKNLETLPATLDEAIALAEKSEFVKSVLSPGTAAAYLGLLRQSAEPSLGDI